MNMENNTIVEQKEEKSNNKIKLFGKWDNNFSIQDMGLRSYINLEPRIVPRSAGIHRKTFHKSKMHIVERLALHLLVPGHRGKKHRLTSGPMSGNLINTLSAIEGALQIIEKKEGKNPLEIFVRALENVAVKEEIISYQLGSVVARESVITAPQRRVDKALRLFAQGVMRRSFKKNNTLAQALAEEILLAYKGSGDSFVLKEKLRIESEAAGAR